MMTFRALSEILSADSFVGPAFLVCFCAFSYFFSDFFGLVSVVSSLGSSRTLLLDGVDARREIRRLARKGTARVATGVAVRVAVVVDFVVVGCWWCCVLFVFVVDADAEVAVVAIVAEVAIVVVAVVAEVAAIAIVDVAIVVIVVIVVVVVVGVEDTICEEGCLTFLLAVGLSTHFRLEGELESERG